jgi:hypothetical protein
MLIATRPAQEPVGVAGPGTVDPDGDEPASEVGTSIAVPVMAGQRTSAGKESVRTLRRRRSGARKLPPGDRGSVASPGSAGRQSLESLDIGIGEGELDGSAVLLEPLDALGSRNRYDIVALGH